MFEKVKKYGEASLLYKKKQELCLKPELVNLFWETTLRCNEKCAHCGSKAGEKAKYDNELSAEEIKSAFKSVAENTDSSKVLINVTGGEPLLRKDLFEVMEYASSLGFKWGMTTNGTLISDEIIENMKKTNLDCISISLDGLEENHDTFRGVRGAYVKTIYNIKKLVEANIPNVSVTTVVNKKNINELDKIFEIVSSLKVKNWRVINIEPIGRTNDNQNLLLDKEEYKRLFEYIAKKRKETNGFVVYSCPHYFGMNYEKEIRSDMFFCYSGIVLASICYNGDVTGCLDIERRPELVQGNIREEDFWNIWTNKFEWFRDLNKFKTGKCAKCKDWEYCLGDGIHCHDFEKNEPKICMKEILK